MMQWPWRIQARKGPARQGARAETLEGGGIPAEFRRQSPRGGGTENGDAALEQFVEETALPVVSIAMRRARVTAIDQRR